MREIVISKYPKEVDDSTHSINIVCEDFKDLNRYIQTAQRMRPDRIIVEYHEYLHRA